MGYTFFLQGDSDSGLSRQNSQATDEEIGRSDDLEDDEDEQQLPEDVEPRMLTKEEKQKREAAYDTISRSQSELDLRKVKISRIEIDSLIF